MAGGIEKGPGSKKWATAALVVFAGVLATALLTPLFKSLLRERRIDSSLAKLHEVHQAWHLYVSDHGDVYDAATYPSSSVVYSPVLGVEAENFRSACAPPIDSKLNQRLFTVQYVPRSEERSQDYFNTHKGKAMLFLDGSCTSSPDEWVSPISVKLGLGVTVDGNLVRKQSRGDAMLLEWWHRENWLEQGLVKPDQE